MTYEVLPRCAEGCLDVQGERAQTPSAGMLKHRQLQDVFVQVHSDVSSQFIREVMQQLRKRTETNKLFKLFRKRLCVETEMMHFTLLS